MGTARRMLRWLRPGPPGAAAVPLLALLPRRLADDEVVTVADTLIRRGDFDTMDIGVRIWQVTDELPTPDQVDRVRAQLARCGRPLD